jgi:PAS domain-containing protein
VREPREINFSELTFRTAILDSLLANIAVLDPAGEILAVNLSWKEFAKANQLNDANLGVGANYLDVCRAASLDPIARAALQGIRAVMSGDRSSFYLKYPCHSPREVRWFALRASPLVDYPHFVVVSHENITEQVLARIGGRPRR